MMFWNRVVSVKAGDKEFTNDKFTIDFDIPFSTKEEPDIAEIRLYNISKSSISNIKSKNYIIVNAGYEGDTGSIATGRVESIETEWSGVDKITTIKISDGGLEWRNASIQKAYKAGTKASAIMADLTSVIGLEVAEIKPKNDIAYKLGKSIGGNVSKALGAIVKDTNSKMYISKGRVYIRDKNRGTTAGFVLNSDTGLIGSPERVEEEIDGKTIIKYNAVSLLNHKIGIDSLIEVKSRAINGRFRVESGRHTGDFKTELTMLPV